MHSATHAARERLRHVFDPELFRHHAGAVVHGLETYLERSANAAPLHPESPAALKARAAELWDKAADSPSSYADVVSLLLAHGHRLHSPRYMGHQVPPPIPLAGLTEAVVGVTNQGGALFEVSPMSSAIERAVIVRLGQLLGWKEGFDGFFTSGGTLANLTALTTARNLRYPTFWEAGCPSDKRPAILVGEDSHYSVQRACGMLGLGTRNVLRVPLDDKRRLRAAALEEAFTKARSQGLDPFAVVAIAGTTAIGAFDPLDEVGAFCREKGVWLHVDGCHGMSVILSKRHRALLKGIEQGDSISWDAHKMLYMPSLSTVVLYRQAAHAAGTFPTDAPYVFDPKGGGTAEYDHGLRTFECTRRTMAVPLWAAWSVHGPQVFEDLVDVTFELATTFFQLLRKSDDFEPLHEPQANIVCFRHVPGRLRGASREAVSEFQGRLRRKAVENGEFYITGNRLDGDAVLRVTLINPATEPHNLEELLTKLRSLGQAL